MLTFERTSDYALIRAVLTDPSQYRMAGDDGAPEPSAFAPNEHPAICYLAARGGYGDLLGVFTLIPENTVTWQIHAALLPRAWGGRQRESRTRPALAGALAWAFLNLHAQRITAQIPAYNRLALDLARDCGLSPYGRNPACFLKWGALHDVILTGISRP